MNTIASTQEQGKRVEVSKEALEISRVHATAYQKEGTLTAEIKQTVITKSFYPSKSVSNNLKDNPFNLSEFGFSETEYSSSEKRVAWVEIPVGSTVESMQARLAMFPEATIYKILANKPIISDSQEYAIKQGLTSKDLIADKQVVRYGDNHEKAGQLILDKYGKPQYKQTFFKKVAKEDEDLRTEIADDYYATPLIKAELANVSTSITVEQEVL
jgi:hypothetical protein